MLKTNKLDRQSLELLALLQLPSFEIAFSSGTSSNEKSTRKSLFDEESASSIQGNIDELKGFCSGVFIDK